ncbi:MAG: tRNA threonylcarbamoyladenosine biosynthesis protein TsaE [Lentimonas sp.]|jgi:tRNA threonylcarbamoyladenosine biosynthesis protein TsaE
MQESKSYELGSIQELPMLATQLLNDFGEHKIWAFDAEMGMGKTTIISALIKALGIEEFEGSPTYSLVNTYISPYKGKVSHFDLYRLDNEEEAYDIGMEEFLYDEGLCFIEWPKKIENLLPEETIWLYISKIDESQVRSIRVEL